MKTNEFKEKMELLGFKLIRRRDDWVITIIGDVIGTATVSAKDTSYCISSLPSKVANIIVEFANTPVEDRKDEKRWNVVVGQDVDKAGEFSIWRRPEYHGLIEDSFIDAEASLNDLKDPTTIFTDSEFNQLIKYLEALPHGGIYAKIAELGRREVTANDASL
ncbi:MULTISPECIES: hypothetical protein [Lactobacillaceae]|uniref:hypothetical protein n=1 Tax=Lactobacillaceae TaxID=33958 RepID=UPI001456D9F3|nr:hypothetical protein [Lactobacillus sp. HBUAS51381]NLR08686.1 hypothetical protein [Lactobacillus sp. HBUAS51381]